MQNLILIGLVAAAIYYIPTIAGLLKLKIKLFSVLPVKIAEKSITLNLILQYTNSSSTTINLQHLNADVYFNGLRIGNIQNVYSIPILPGRQQNAAHTIEINSDILGDKLWQEAISFNLHNFVIELKCRVTANNKTFNMNTAYTLQDITK